MKKFLLVICCLGICLIIFSIIGYRVVSANQMVDEINDIIALQNDKDSYYSTYEYTIDNPHIIVNPYDISPLTALILFETEKEVSITVTINGKTPEGNLKNTFLSSKKHIIPVYGLYPDYDNTVILSYEDIRKEYKIHTDKLPNDFEIEKNTEVKDITFVSSGKYPYAIDSNKDIRWYLTKNYSGKITPLNNGHFLFGNDTFILSKIPRNLLEIDLLGKIYYQYLIEDGYYGSYAEVGNSLFVLSKDLLEIDKQNGVILNRILLKDNYETVSYHSDTDMIEVVGDKAMVIKRENLDVATASNVQKVNEKIYFGNLYMNKDEYRITKGVKFNHSLKTEETNKNIFLVGYKNIDENYLKHDIQITKSTDFLQISGNFNKDDQVYVILEKFLSKKSYKLINGHLIINHQQLNGKYSIYLKINDIIYKTNYYVKF